MIKALRIYRNGEPDELKWEDIETATWKAA